MTVDIEKLKARIANSSLKELRVLRERALRLGQNAAVRLCDEAIDRPSKTPGSAVMGFHFICRKGEGVKFSPADRSVWSGAWVVEEAKAEDAVRYGAYLALHEKRDEPSYLQGIIRNWRPTTHDFSTTRPVGNEHRVDFYATLSPSPYKWVGDGAGEKGYFWAEPMR